VNKGLNVRAGIAIRSVVGLVGLSSLGLALSGLVLLSCSGCGGGSGGNPVHGKVVIDGKPVETGTIAFVPTGAAKGSVAGGTISGGAYSIPRDKGPVAGPHRVEFRATQKTGRKVPAGSPAPPGTMIEEEKSLTPPHLNNESKIQKDIKSGDNEIDFDLKSTP
jgi:hypothetical protein